MRFNHLVKEWAWRVNNGMPDPKKRTHLQILEDVLRDYKYSEDFIQEYILQIEAVCQQGQNPGRDGCVAADGSKGTGKKVKKEPESKEGPTDEQQKKQIAKKKFLSNVVDLIMKEDESAGMGAGRFNMSKEDLNKYKKYLDGEKPELPNYNISDNDADTIIEAIKEKDKKFWNSMRERLRKKGDPPKKYRSGEAGSQRIKEVLKFYCKTGGRSSITGEVIPFNQTQLDHVTSLDNGGKDEPENWEFMESRFNQFKGALADDAVMNKIKKELDKSPEEEKKKILKTQLKQYKAKAYIEYWDKKFKSGGDHGLTETSISKMKGDEVDFLIKGWNKSHPEDSEHFVARYKAGDDRSSGRKSGGKKRNKPELVKEIMTKMKSAGLDIPSEAETKQIDNDMQKIINEVEKKKGEIKSLKIK